MINAIHKYTLDIRSTAVQTLEIPEGSTWLTTLNQNSKITMWFEVDKDAPKFERQFQVFLTGDVPEFQDHHVYRGTLIFEHLVVHIYEIIPERRGGYVKGYRPR